MNTLKRVFLFCLVNVLIVISISLLAGLLGLAPELSARGLSLERLAVFCLFWGFGGAFISLGLSRVMAKWMMGVKLVQPHTRSLREQELIDTVHALSRQAGLEKMPEVGIYDSPEINAFATGPTRNRALVAVSSGLLEAFDREQVRGVLAHEVAHVANGDMVTMTLVQGVVNALVMFVARVAGWFASQLASEERRPWVQMGTILASEVVLGFLGMLVVAKFSRAREYRADEGGAVLLGTGPMIAALEGLRRASRLDRIDEESENLAPALASLKIAGKSKGWLALFSTHPDLEDRIDRLKSLQHGSRMRRSGMRSRGYAPHREIAW